ncbi:MAG: hypothetical protein J7M16_15085 [Anaerolineae bacterium]|nr:hypothetical protein [Anaerolineae bacterium]
MTESQRIGEIVETSTTSFVAVSKTLHQPPALGSLVKVQLGGEDYTYGVVAFGTTTSPDPGRRAVPRASDEVYDEAIYAAQPQLTRVLHTEFTVVLVGCFEEGTIRQHLPPQPPRLHYDVHGCTSDEVRRFSERLVYFRLLLSARGEVPAEQLLAAHIRQVYRARDRDAAWLERAAREVTSLLRDDYDRMMTVLYGIEPAG